MNPTDFSGQAEDYRRVAQAIHFIEQNVQQQPTLDEVAAAVHLSPYHFHRLFRRWAGVTPKQFLQFLTVDYAKSMLAESNSVLDTSLAAGLSGPGRLHDMFVTLEAVTPGEFKSGGSGLHIAYGFHPTPFGDCLLATTARGICALTFVEDAALEQARARALAQLARDWPEAVMRPEPQQTAPLVAQIFADQPPQLPFHVLVKGTNFQVKVWSALLQIPPGGVTSYSAVAARLNRPSASRAVANAIGLNPVGYLIPCHRVIRKVGAIASYRWGAERKRAILAWEAGHRLAA
ncbi:MAG: methylated-DNA--[protein]-cysteine S-methyltransferase [Anaerolineae bacterium]